jgi:hypothetical protein
VAAKAFTLAPEEALPVVVEAVILAMIATISMLTKSEQANLFALSKEPLFIAERVRTALSRYTNIPLWLTQSHDRPGQGCLWSNGRSLFQL